MAPLQDASGDVNDEHPEVVLQSIEDSTKAGMAWASIARVSVLVVQFGSTIVLARLLTPDQYGLIAIVAGFTAFALLFTDLGLGSAIIHANKVTEDLLCTAFWLNLISGALLTGLLSALAVPIAHFYHSGSLASLLILASLTFTLSASTVNLALLEREMRFKVIAGVELTAAVVGLSTAVMLASLGVGAASVIWGVLTQAATTTLLMWLASGWLPSRFASRAAMGQLWSFSRHLVAFNSLTYWARNLDDLLLGKFAGPANLAIYYRAYQLMLLPVQQVTLAVGRVLFPALARLRGDHDRLRTAYLRVLRMLIGIIVPLSLGLAAVATALVHVLYGSRWSGTAPILAILAASGPAQVVCGTVGAVYRALGLTRSLLRRAFINTAVIVCAILLGLHWGVKGVATALLLNYYLMAPVTLGGCWKYLGLTVVGVLSEMRALIACSAVMAFSMVGAGWLVHREAKVVVLLAQCIVGALVYVGGIAIFARPFAMEVVGMVRRRPERSGRGA